MAKDSFVIKAYNSKEERETGSEPFAIRTLHTLEEFDRVFSEYEAAGKFLAYESETGVKLKHEACRFFLDKQEKELQDN